MFHGSLFVRSVKILEIPSRSVPPDDGEIPDRKGTRPIKGKADTVFACLYDTTSRADSREKPPGQNEDTQPAAPDIQGKILLQIVGNRGEEGVGRLFRLSRLCCLLLIDQPLNGHVQSLGQSFQALNVRQGLSRFP